MCVSQIHEKEHQQPQKMNHKYIIECVCLYIMQLSGENSHIWVFLLSMVSLSIEKNITIKYTNNKHEADYKYAHMQQFKKCSMMQLDS